MSVLRVTGIQMQVAPSKKDNLPRVLDYIKKGNSDFILFPELSLTGYQGEVSEERLREAWKLIATACRQHYVTAIIGTTARIEQNTYIQSRIYTDHGELLGAQEKIVPTSSDRAWCRPGEELRIFNHKNLPFGCLVGNDLWVAPGFGPYPDPRLSLQLARKGAQVIFHSAHTGSDMRYAAYYESNLRLRALESKVHIVTVNAAAEGGGSAPSGVIGPDGEWIVQAPREGEQIFSFDLEMETE